LSSYIYRVEGSTLKLSRSDVILALVIGHFPVLCKLA
jgi:hypothetical protein